MAQQYNVGGALAHPLAAEFVNLIAEALTPKAVRKQAQQQMAMETIARMQPHISKLPQEAKERFYNQFVFPSVGVYNPPLLRQAFGAKPETVLPLPKGAAELTGEEKIKTPRGKIATAPPGIRQPSSQPWDFPEAVDAQEMRDLIKQQKEESVLKSEATRQAMRAAPPWAPTTEEQYREFHPPAVRAPTTHTIKKNISGVPMQIDAQWNPETSKFEPMEGSDWVPVHPPKEAKEKEQKIRLTEPVRKGLRVQLMKIALSDPSKYFGMNKEQYDQFMTNVASKNPRPEEMYDAWYNTISPEYRRIFDQIAGMSEKYVDELGEFGAINQALHEWQSGQSGSFRKVAPPASKSVGTQPPSVRQPTVIKYDAQGNRVQ